MKKEQQKKREPPAAGKGFTVRQPRIRAARLSFHVSVLTGIGRAITRRIKMAYGKHAKDPGASSPAFAGFIFDDRTTRAADGLSSRTALPGPFLLLAIRRAVDTVASGRYHGDIKVSPRNPACLFAFDISRVALVLTLRNQGREAREEGGEGSRTSRLNLFSRFTASTIHVYCSGSTKIYDICVRDGISEEWEIFIRWLLITLYLC